MSKVHAYAVGIVSLSACAPAGMPPGQVEAEVNAQDPTGLDGCPWRLAGDEKKFADGKPNPGPCEQEPGRMHYLFHC